MRSIIRRKKPGYRKYSPEQVGENILNREFEATKPNEKWLSDVTEFKVNGTSLKLYLCAIIDLYDNSIVAYHLSNRNDNNLVFTTLRKAIKANPGAKPILHSDRGYQYTSKQFKRILDEHGITQSMSRVGKCIDNGPIENFWRIIKSEMYYLDSFNSMDKLIKSIHEYMNFYNTKRLQSKLKSHTPIEYRNMAI